MEIESKERISPFEDELYDSFNDLLTSLLALVSKIQLCYSGMASMLTWESDKMKMTTVALLGYLE